jgi:endonuclease/exonuclease/phosphatase family metal-dependent hydrolase
MEAFGGEETPLEISLKVATFNIRHGKGHDGVVDLSKILAELKDLQADVIGLQEVDRYNIRSGFADQISVLGSELGMFWAFSPSLGLGWVQYGNAILSKHPITSAEMHALPGQWEARSVLKAVVSVKDVHVHFFNTHLGLSAADRMRQMPVLAELLATDGEPAVLMGDFNMVSSHPYMQALPSGWEKVELTGQEAMRPGREVDHIYVSGKTASKQAVTVPSGISDHQPVIAEIVWER